MSPVAGKINAGVKQSLIGTDAINAFRLKQTASPERPRVLEEPPNL